VVAIYSTFLQRAYDQLIHDIAIQNLPVVLAIDRGGLVGADGATHAGSFDLSFLRCIPNMTVMAQPTRTNAPDAVYRLPVEYAERGALSARYGAGAAICDEMCALPVAKASCARFGHKWRSWRSNDVGSCSAAGEELHASVANMRFVKPLDAELCCASRASTNCWSPWKKIPCRAWGSACGILQQHGVAVPLLQLGLPDSFIEQGDHGQLLANCGLDAKGLVASVKKD